MLTHTTHIYMVLPEFILSARLSRAFNLHENTISISKRIRV